MRMWQCGPCLGPGGPPWPSDRLSRLAVVGGQKRRRGAGREGCGIIGEADGAAGHLRENGTQGVPATPPPAPGLGAAEDPEQMVLGASRSK